MLHKAWNSKGEMPYCFPRSSIKFQGHTVQNITDFDPNWAFPDHRLVAAFKSLRFALFQGQTLFWPYLRNGWSDWCEMKRKCIGWILGTICDLDLWPHSWPWPWMSDWCEMKRKWVNMILGWLYDLALWPHPLSWPWSFKVRVWYSFISGMGRPIDNEWKDVTHPFMIMISISVTMVGWADLPDSDPGDFRRRHAIDISSCVFAWIDRLDR